MTVWLAAVLLLLPPLFVALFVALRANASNRLAAVQLAGAFTALIIALMSFAFDQSSFVDIALCAMFLTVPGTYLFAVFMERWL